MKSKTARSITRLTKIYVSTGRSRCGCVPTRQFSTQHPPRPCAAAPMQRHDGFPAKRSASAGESYVSERLNILDPAIFTEPRFWLRAGRFRCPSPPALRVEGNADGDDHGRPHLGSAIWGKIVSCIAVRRSERMTSPRPRAFSVFAMAIGSAGVMDRPSAAPGSLAKGRTRRALRPRRGPASSADPRSAAARRHAAPARAGGAGSSPCPSPSRAVQF